jgi:hypothetical protein
MAMAPSTEKVVVAGAGETGGGRGRRGRGSLGGFLGRDAEADDIWVAHGDILHRCLDWEWVGRWTREERREEMRLDFFFLLDVDQGRGRGRWEGAVLFLVVRWPANGVKSNLWWELLYGLIQWLYMGAQLPTVVAGYFAYIYIGK